MNEAIKFALIGGEGIVQRTRSPALFKKAFGVTQTPGSFEVFEVKELEAWLNENLAEFDGVLVTNPHKKGAFEWAVYYGISIESPLELESLNLIYWRKDKLCATSTDLHAMREMLTAKSVLIQGSGAMARTAAFVCKEKGIPAGIEGRNKKEVALIAKDFGLKVGGEYQHILNCTPTRREGMNLTYPARIKKATETLDFSEAFLVCQAAEAFELVTQQYGDPAGLWSVKDIMEYAEF